MPIDAKTFSREIEGHIHPATLPFVLKLLMEGDFSPRRAKSPLLDMKMQIPTRRAIELVRRRGWTLLLGAEDLNCPFDRTLFGLTYGSECSVNLDPPGQVSRGKEGHSLGNGTVEKRYKHLAVLPAACADFEPDAVVIYCNSAQLLRLAMAAMWNRGYNVSGLFAGRIGCSEEIIRMMLCIDFRIIVPDCGHEAEDGEFAFCLPGDKMSALIEGLDRASSCMRPIDFSSDDCPS